jgi:hypothetical protein
MANRPERMFCIKENRVALAEPGLKLSHREWFQREGWIGKEGNGDEESFFHHVVSGWYVPDKDAIYCFREIGLEDDPEVIEIVVHHLLQLKKSLGLGEHTKVFIGPRDAESDNEDSRRYYAGTLDELAKSIEKYERKTEGWFN